MSAIRIEDDSLVVTHDHGEASIPCAEITAISAYCIDCMTHTTVLVTFDHESGEIIEVDAADLRDQWPQLLQLFEIAEDSVARLDTLTPADECLFLFQRV